jgi:hypothetical protein
MDGELADPLFSWPGLLLIGSLLEALYTVCAVPHIAHIVSNSVHSRSKSWWRRFVCVFPHRRFLSLLLFIWS